MTEGQDSQEKLTEFTMASNETPETKTDRYKEIVDSGKDETYRKRVAASIALGPKTNQEIQEHTGMEGNTVRPRTNELLRMGCIKRDGERETKDGNAATVHHITPLGLKYLNGKKDPDPRPTETELKNNLVDKVRQYFRGHVDRETVERALIKHDKAKADQDPDWNAQYVSDKYVVDLTS